MNDILREIEKPLLTERKVRFNPGDTLRVHVRIKEGDKERIQVFQGTVIGRRGGGLGETFTVRKVSGGIGVERVFPLHSPNVAKIERIREGRVRRAKLNYLRGLTGKSARITEKKRDTDAAAETGATAAKDDRESTDPEIEATDTDQSGDDSGNKAETEEASGAKAAQAEASA
jgi:large subunit ribosomal protein L19